MKLPRDPAPIAFAFFLCEFWMKTLKLTTWTEIVFLRPILQTLGWEIILGWLDILEIAFNIEKGITILLRLSAHYLKHFEGSLNIDIWSSPVALNQFISRGVDPGKIYWIKDADAKSRKQPHTKKKTKRQQDQVNSKEGHIRLAMGKTNTLTGFQEIKISRFVRLQNIIVLKW